MGLIFNKHSLNFYNQNSLEIPNYGIYIYIMVYRSDTYEKVVQNKWLSEGKKKKKNKLQNHLTFGSFQSKIV